MVRRVAVGVTCAVALAGCGGGGTAGGIHSDQVEQQMKREIIVGLGDGQQPTEAQFEQASKVIDVSCEPDGDSAHDCAIDIEELPEYHCRIPASGGRIDTKNADCEGRAGLGLLGD